jgi:hypothetical protein
MLKDIKIRAAASRLAEILLFPIQSNFKRIFLGSRTFFAQDFVDIHKNAT